MVALNRSTRDRAVLADTANHHQARPTGLEPATTGSTVQERTTKTGEPAGNIQHDAAVGFATYTFLGL